MARARSIPRVDLRALLGRLPPLPWVSVCLVLLVLAPLPATEIGFGPVLESARRELQSAVSFFIRHPMLEIPPRLLPVLQDEMPGYQGNELFAFLNEDGRERAAQAEFEALVERGFAALDAHPARSLGVVPAAPHPWAFLTHPFVHSGWLHGLATAVVLLLFAPLLERTWGRGPLAAAALGSAVLGAGIFCVVHGGLDRPLVGGAGLVVACGAAIAVRFRGDEVNLLEWLSPVADAELRAPGWGALIVLAGYETALWWIAPSGAWPSVDTAVGYTAHAAAALAGGLAALALARTGLEQRFGRPPEVRTRSAAAPQRFDLAKVKRLHDRGDLEGAYQMLIAETRRSARNRTVVRMLWDLAVERETPEEAVPAMHGLVREELRRGAVPAALSHWRALDERHARPLLHPEVLLQLVPAAREGGGDAEVRTLLQQVMDVRDASLPSELACEVVQLAADLDRDLAVAAAEVACRDRALEAEQRERLQALIDDARAREDAPPDIPVPAELPESPFFAGQDRSAFGDVAEDLSGVAEEAAAGTAAAAPHPSPPRPLQIADALPEALAPDGLALLVSGRGPSRLEYARIGAVAFAGVRGLGPRPVVLVDLILRGGEDASALRVVRLRSDGFDPRSLVPEVGSPLDALRAFAAELAKRSRARLLTDPQANPLPVFDSADAYAREVLKHP